MINNSAKDDFLAVITFLFIIIAASFAPAIIIKIHENETHGDRVKSIEPRFIDHENGVACYMIHGSVKCVKLEGAL